MGVVLASRERHDDAERAAAGRLSVGLALVAAVGFGSYFVLSDAAADDSVLWLLALSRIIPVPALALFAWPRGMRPPPARTASILVAAGTLDCGATALYGVANTKGALSIVAVVGSLYPVMTLILARAVLGERIRPRAAGGRRGGAGRRRDDRGGLACSSCRSRSSSCPRPSRGSSTRCAPTTWRARRAPSRAGGARASWAACA